MLARFPILTAMSFKDIMKANQDALLNPQKEAVAKEKADILKPVNDMKNLLAQNSAVVAGKPVDCEIKNPFESPAGQELLVFSVGASETRLKKTANYLSDDYDEARVQQVIANDTVHPKRWEYLQDTFSFDRDLKDEIQHLPPKDRIVALETILIQTMQESSSLGESTNALTRLIPDDLVFGNSENADTALTEVRKIVNWFRDKRGEFKLNKSNYLTKRHRKSSHFKEFVESLKRYIKAEIHKLNDPRDFDSKGKSTNLNSFFLKTGEKNVLSSFQFHISRDPLLLVTIFGGVQLVECFISNSKLKPINQAGSYEFSAKIRLRITDVFGVSNSDLYYESSKIEVVSTF